MTQQRSGVAGFPWPDGRTSAAAFTFDLDAEAAWAGEDPANADRPGVLSQGSYGPKVAMPLIVVLLERMPVRAVKAPDVWVATCAESAAHADGILQ